MELLQSKARRHPGTHSTVPRSWLPTTKLPPSSALAVTWLPSELLHWNAAGSVPSWRELNRVRKASVLLHRLPGIDNTKSYQQTFKAPSRLER